MEGIPSLQLGIRVLETFSHPDAGSNVQRPRDLLHFLSHTVDHVSWQMVDLISTNFLESSSFFEDNKTDIRMNMKGRSAILRHVSRG